MPILHPVNAWLTDLTDKTGVPPYPTLHGTFKDSLSHQRTSSGHQRCLWLWILPPFLKSSFSGLSVAVLIDLPNLHFPCSLSFEGWLATSLLFPLSVKWLDDCVSEYIDSHCTFHKEFLTVPSSVCSDMPCSPAACQDGVGCSRVFSVLYKERK